MTHFLISVCMVLFLFCGQSATGEVQVSAGENFNTSAKEYNLDEYSYRYGNAYIFNHVADKENKRNSYQNKSSKFKKFLNGIHFFNKCTELTKGNEIAGYVFISDYQIIRLEVNDIIYPFHYFW